jgi:iron complex outermembrane receptor protein
VEEVEARGIELELEGKWTNGSEARISYSFQETENKATGNALTNSPRHLAKLNLVVPIFRGKIFLGMEELYRSKARTLAGGFTDDFFVTNLTIFRWKDLLGQVLQDRKAIP